MHRFSQILPFFSFLMVLSFLINLICAQTYRVARLEKKGGWRPAVDLVFSFDYKDDFDVGTVFDNFVLFNFCCAPLHINRLDAPNGLCSFCDCILRGVFPALWWATYQFDYFRNRHFCLSSLIDNCQCSLLFCSQSARASWLLPTREKRMSEARVLASRDITTSH